jgi:hypothetical protein
MSISSSNFSQILSAEIFFHAALKRPQIPSACCPGKNFKNFLHSYKKMININALKLSPKKLAAREMVLPHRKNEHKAA